MAEYEERRSLNKKLGRYIESFSQVLGRRPANAHDVMPAPGTSMIFSFERMLYNKEIFLSKAVAGFHSKPFHFESFSDYANSFTIKFSPYGLSRFIDEPLHTFANEITKASTLFGKDIEELYQDLQQTELFSTRVALAEEYLLKRLKEPTEIEKAIFHFADELLHAQESVSIDELRKNIPLKKRELEHTFKMLIGTDIHTFIRVAHDNANDDLFHRQEGVPFANLNYPQKPVT